MVRTGIYYVYMYKCYRPQIVVVRKSQVVSLGVKYLRIEIYFSMYVPLRMFVEYSTIKFFSKADENLGYRKFKNKNFRDR